MDTGEQTWLTYREAARRVRRAEISVRRWRREGLPMQWGIRDGQRVRLVREDVLLAWWRDRMRSSPVHYYRMRARALELGVAPPSPPSCLTR